MPNMMKLLPELEAQEQLFVGELIKDLSDDQANTFAISYRAQRKDPTTVLLLPLLGLGIGRFYLGQVGMGLLYIFTGGFCIIGTIIDIVAHKKLAFQYNQLKAQEAAMMVKGSS